MKYRAKSKKTQEESWGKRADVVKDTLSCFLCTRNLQMYVGRATVREQREAGVYTSGNHLAGGRVQTLFASAAFRHTLPCRLLLSEGPAIQSLSGPTTVEALPKWWVFVCISSVTWKSLNNYKKTERDREKREAKRRMCHN